MGKLDYAKFLHGDAKKQLKSIENNSIHSVITSPPYFGLRDYHADGQIGLEENLEHFISNLTEVFNEVRRVLHPSGTFWLNIGDSYAGSGGPGGDFRDGKGGDNYGRSYDRDVQGLKKKDLCMVPARVALRQQSEGWWLRSEIIWAKALSFNDKYSGSCMPESAPDRPTNGHEKLYLFSKSRDYFYDEKAVAEKIEDPSRIGEVRGNTGHSARGEEKVNQIDPNQGVMKPTKKLRDVWTFNPASFTEEHFATYPLGLVEPCVKAGTPAGGVCSDCKTPYKRNENSWKPDCDCDAKVEPATVLDPFSGAATTGIAALKHGRKYIGIDINEDYNELAKDRIREHKEVPANHSFW
jgi:DNA modification methylase